MITDLFVCHTCHRNRLELDQRTGLLVDHPPAPGMNRGRCSGSGKVPQVDCSLCRPAPEPHSGERRGL